MGWSGLGASLTVHVMPGDHASILRPPAVDRLASILESELGETPSDEDDAANRTAQAGHESARS